MLNCKYCGKALTGRQRLFCSNTCKDYSALRAWRRRTKARAVEFLGGKCKRCRYSICQRSLIFHHPGQKSYGISGRSSWEAVVSELQKCVLLCLNCHGEEHCQNDDCLHV